MCSNSCEMIQLPVDLKDFSPVFFFEKIVDNNFDLSYDEIIKYIPLKFAEFASECEKRFKSFCKIKHNISNYSYDILSQSIFDSEPFEANKAQNYFKDCSIAILKLLENTKKELSLFLCDEVRKNCSYRHILNNKCQYVHTLLLHIYDFIQNMEMFHNKSSNFKCSLRFQVYAQETLDLARRLPRNETYNNDLVQSITAAFLLRQSIELKILEILNIKYVIDKNSAQPIKITAIDFVPLIRKLLQSSNSQYSVNEALIRKIHTWANPYVHTGRILYMWEVEIARLSIQDFIISNCIIHEKKQIISSVFEIINKNQDSCEIIWRS